MKKPTNIKIKTKAGKEVEVMIDDDEPVSSPSRKVNEDGTISRNAAALIEDGILAKVNQIVAEAICTADLISIDPSDTWGKGKVIAKAGTISSKEYAAALAGVNDAWLRIGEDLILPPTADKMMFMRKANADLMTARLRTEMTNGAAELEDDMAPEDAKPLLAWTSDIRIENFAEWLIDRGGWIKATAKKKELCDELKRCFAGVPASVGKVVQHDNIKGDETIGEAFKFIPIRLAGKHSAPVKRELLALVVDETPKDYLDGLEMSFRDGLWDVTLKTADKDERDELGKAVPVEDSFAWLRMMVRPYVEEQAAGIRETRMSSISIMVRPRARTADGHDWTGIPRVLNLLNVPIITGPFSVTYNGEEYAQMPTLAEKAVHGTLRTIQRQQSVQVVAASWVSKDKSEQYTLAFNEQIVKPHLRDTKGAPLRLESGPLEVVMNTATAGKLPAMTLKALPYMIANCGLTGRRALGTLEQVANDLYPAWATGKDGQIKPWNTRGTHKQDLQNITHALVTAGRGLQVRIDYVDGNWSYTDLFDMVVPGAITPEARIGWSMSEWLLEKMLGGAGGGFFLLDMHRWLPIGLTDPGLFSVIMRIAGTLDTHRIGGLYKPERARPIRWDEFAASCNVLPLASDKRDEESIKRSYRESRDKLEARLDRAVVLGHLGDYKKTMKKLPGGKGFEFTIVAPPDYVEACRLAAHAWRSQARHENKKRTKGPGK